MLPVQALVKEKYQIFNGEVMPALTERGVRVISHGDRNQA